MFKNLTISPQKQKTCELSILLRIFIGECQLNLYYFTFYLYCLKSIQIMKLPSRQYFGSICELLKLTIQFVVEIY